MENRTVFVQFVYAAYEKTRSYSVKYKLPKAFEGIGFLLITKNHQALIYELRGAHTNFLALIYELSIKRRLNIIEKKRLRRKSLHYGSKNRRG